MFCPLCWHEIPDSSTTCACCGSSSLHAKPVVADRYQLHSAIGGGHFSTVWRAFDRWSRAWVALKILGYSPEAEYLLHNELALSRQVSHPNVGRVLDGGMRARCLCYVAMELIEGDTLQKLRGTFSAAHAYPLALQAAAGLQAIHEQARWIHRDVKSNNIMLDKSGQIRVLDFGVAKSLKFAAVSANTIVGWPGYMSPEQLKGRKMDPRSDIYSLGIVFFELFTGELPFDEPDLVSKQLEAPPPLAHARLPEALRRLLQTMLSKKPEGRPPDMKAVIEQLEAAQRVDRPTLVVAPALDQLLEAAARETTGPVGAVHLFAALTRRWIVGHQFFDQIGQDYIVHLTHVRRALGAPELPTTARSDWELAPEAKPLAQALRAADEPEQVELQALKALSLVRTASEIEAALREAQGPQSLAELVQGAEAWLSQGAPERRCLFGPEALLRSDLFLTDLGLQATGEVQRPLSAWHLMTGLIGASPEVAKRWTQQRLPPATVVGWRPGSQLRWTDLDPSAGEALLRAARESLPVTSRRLAYFVAEQLEESPLPDDVGLRLESQPPDAWRRRLRALRLSLI